MNQHTTPISSEDKTKSLSFGEKRQLLSPQGIVVSKVSEILWKSPITLSTSLKKIWMKGNFSELPPQGNARVIKFTRAWVRALLEQLASNGKKKTRSTGGNIVQISDKPGMVFADFRQEMQNLGYTATDLSTVWNHLTKTYPKCFSLTQLKERQTPAYKLKPEHKERIMELAKEYVGRKGSAWRKNTSAPARRTSIR